MDTLQLGVKTGAYPNIEAALDRLDKEIPAAQMPNHVFSISRMILVNRDIDDALFRMARSTSAWTWLNDYRLLFVLTGHKLCGSVLHEGMKRPVPFRLLLHNQQDGTRFLRFYGDVPEERSALSGRRHISPLQMLSHKMGQPVSEVRDCLEALVRTCDDTGWTHALFPFIHQARLLDAPHRLLKQHKLLVHSPFVRIK